MATIMLHMDDTLDDKKLTLENLALGKMTFPKTPVVDQRMTTSFPPALQSCVDSHYEEARKTYS